MNVSIPDTKWIPEPNTGCWLWLGLLNPSGYGKFYIKPKYRGAHRVMWEQHNGEIPEGIFVLHRCDTPSCVNPSHLFLGTNKDNLLDASRKGRIAHGERAGKCKLTKEQVLKIRVDSRPNSQIATEYGVRSNQVSRIKCEKTWRHLW